MTMSFDDSRPYYEAHDIAFTPLRMPFDQDACLVSDGRSVHQDNRKKNLAEYKPVKASVGSGKEENEFTCRPSSTRQSINKTGHILIELNVLAGIM